MLYIINETIVFRDDDCSIWSKDDEDSRLQLTVTTCRLLVFLLQHKGEVLQRDEILHKVWDNYGLRSSNNSLNKYISYLRSVLKNLGCEDEIIKTLPRIGFKVSENVFIEKIQSKSFEAIEASIDESITQDDLKKTKKCSAINIGSEKKLFIVVVIFLIAIFIFVYDLMSGVYKNEPSSQNTYPLMRLGNCMVYSLIEIPPVLKDNAINITENAIRTRKIQCSSESVIYIQISGHVLNGNNGRLFLSQCMLNKNSKKILSCNNQYEINHFFPQRQNGN